MPVKDGLAATREILANARHTDWEPYIIGLSAHAMVGDKERAVSEGMREYLTKPISLESLATALKHFLENQQLPNTGAKPHDN